MPQLVHIGHHKTGTTWLQKELFATSDEFLNQGKEGSGDSLAHFFYRDERKQLRSSFDLGAVPEILESTRETLVHNPDKWMVLSDERLSGNPHVAAFDAYSIAHRIHATLPNAYVLCVIREQRSAIFSAYLQYLRTGGAASLEHYLNWKYQGRIPRPAAHYYDYNNIISAYRELFGDRLIVLPYEWLKNEPQTFFASIDERLGTRTWPHVADKLSVRHNATNNYGLEIFLQPLNHLAGGPLKDAAFDLGGRGVRSLLSRLGRNLPAGRYERRARVLIDTWVTDRLAGANAQTMATTGLPLEKLGYLP